MITNKCSNTDLKYVESSLRQIKEYVLFDLANTVLKDLYTYEYLHYDFIEPFRPNEIKREQTPKKLRIIDNYNRCHANVWKNGKKIRCNKHKLKKIDYCRIHLTKRNYGIID